MTDELQTNSNLASRFVNRVLNRHDFRHLSLYEFHKLQRFSIVLLGICLFCIIAISIRIAQNGVGFSILPGVIGIGVCGFIFTLIKIGAPHYQLIVTFNFIALILLSGLAYLSDGYYGFPINLLPLLMVFSFLNLKPRHVLWHCALITWVQLCLGYIGWDGNPQGAMIRSTEALRSFQINALNRFLIFALIASQLQPWVRSGRSRMTFSIFTWLSWSVCLWIMPNQLDLLQFAMFPLCLWVIPQLKLAYKILFIGTNLVQIYLIHLNSKHVFFLCTQEEQYPAFIILSLGSCIAIWGLIALMLQGKLKNR